MLKNYTMSGHSHTKHDKMCPMHSQSLTKPRTAVKNNSLFDGLVFVACGVMGYMVLVML